MPQLTLDQLKQMPPDFVFAVGQHHTLGFYVAVRGGIHDWAVYATHNKFGALDTHEEKIDWVKRCGDKLWKDDAVKLIDADEEAAAMYRE